MTQTFTPPAHRYGNGGFGRPTEEPTVSLRQRPPAWAQAAPASPNHYAGPIPPMAPPH